MLALIILPPSEEGGGPREGAVEGEIYFIQLSHMS